MNIADIKTKQDAIDFVNYLSKTYLSKDVEYISGIIFVNLILDADHTNTKVDRLIQYLDSLEIISNDTLQLLSKLETNVKLGKNNKEM